MAKAWPRDPNCPKPAVVIFQQMTDEEVAAHQRRVRTMSREEIAASVDRMFKIGPNEMFPSDPRSHRG